MVGSESQKAFGDMLDRLKDAGHRELRNELEILHRRDVSDDEVTAESIRRGLRLYEDLFFAD